MAPTYNDTSETVHDAEGGNLSGLPDKSVIYVICGVIMSEKRLRHGSDIVDI